MVAPGSQAGRVAAGELVRNPGSGVSRPPCVLVGAGPNRRYPGQRNQGHLRQDGPWLSMAQAGYQREPGSSMATSGQRAGAAFAFRLPRGRTAGAIALRYHLRNAAGGGPVAGSCNGWAHGVRNRRRRKPLGLGRSGKKQGLRSEDASVRGQVCRRLTSLPVVEGTWQVQGEAKTCSDFDGQAEKTERQQRSRC